MDFAEIRDCRNLTIQGTIDHYALNQPEKVFAFFPDENSEVTWAELRETSRKLARYLLDQGINPGSRVGMLRGNGQAALELFLGAMYSGYTVSTFNPVAGESALRYVFDHSKIQIVFVDEENRALAEAIKKDQMPGLKIVSGAANQGLALPGLSSPIEVTESCASDDALLIYTSGTTGRPKGVIHSNSSLLAGGANTVAAHHLTDKDRALCVLPLCHINGQVVTAIAPLLSGSSVVMPSRFRVSKFWDWIVSYQCTWFSAVPTIISYLLGAEDKESRPCLDRLSSVRFGRSASAALPPAVHNAFVECFGIPLVETMGITETAAPILTNPLNPEGHRIGSPGKACGNEVRIANDSEVVTGINVEGEIQVRGPNLMSHYLDAPDKTAEAFTKDGWYRTGDLGRIDESGYVFVTGRIKELIIKGGENIAPREIDDVLYQFPGILEAAAIGIADDNYGEEIAACLVPGPGVVIDLKALSAHCEKHLGRFKTPCAFHLMDELPKGPSGKIQRLKLVETVSKGN
ncbi:AMP-binding protein [Arenicellales bacterium nBUS_45]